MRPTRAGGGGGADHRALAKVPADRFATAVEFKEALTRALREPAVIRPASGGRRLAVGVAALVVGAGVAAGLLKGLGSDRPVIIDGERPIRSLAVAPLLNLTGDSAQVYLAEGITDQLVSTLTQIGALRVVGLKGDHARRSGEELARDHQIDAILGGSVQREGEAVRITVQLNAAATGQALWARSYDGEMRGVLGLQDQVARSVAERIQVAPQGQDRKAIALDPREVSPAAYEAYVRGTYFLGKVTETNFRKAIGYFQRAIDIEPTYAAAYNGLAECYAELGYYALGSPQDYFPKARAAALKALELDSTFAEAHATLGKVEYLYSWDFSAADREFRRAVELSPKSARIPLMYHPYLAAMGRHAESIAQARLSQERDPLSLIIQGAAARPLYNARRYEDALAQARKALEIDSTFSRAHFWVGLSYEQMNRLDDAIRELQETIARGGRIPVYLAALGHAYAAAGRRDEAFRVLEELRVRARSTYISPFDLATVYLGLNMRDSAFQQLEEAYTGRAYGLVFINVDPRFDVLRADPRFTELIRRIGLPPAEVALARS